MSSLAIQSHSDKNPYQLVYIQKSSSHYPLVKKILQKQSLDVSTLKIGEEYSCELLLRKKDPTGFIVYNCVDNGFCVKSFTLLEPSKWKGKNIDQKLLDRVMKLAKRYGAVDVHLRVSRIEKELIAFFRNREFKILEDPQSTNVELCYTLHTSQSKEGNSFHSPQKKVEGDISTANKKSSPQLSQQEEFASHCKKQEEQSYSRRSDRSYEEEFHSSQPNNRKPSFPSTSSSRNFDRYGRRDRNYERNFEAYDYPTRSSSRYQPYGLNAAYPSQHATPRQHEITLKKMYIHQIRAQRKTVEGRINAGMVLRFRVGDSLRFFYKANPRDDVTCEIVKIEQFNSFGEMLQSCGVQSCLPEVHSLEQGISIYNRIPSYPERAARNGVVAIHLKLIR